MSRTRWRAVSCVDDSLRAHPSQPKAYAWIAGQDTEVKFRVQYDDGFGWSAYATVFALGNGGTDEE
jgi:hypothetical protein